MKKKWVKTLLIILVTTTCLSGTVSTFTNENNTNSNVTILSLTSHGIGG